MTYTNYTYMKFQPMNEIDSKCHLNLYEHKRLPFARIHLKTFSYLRNKFIITIKLLCFDIYSKLQETDVNKIRKLITCPLIELV